MSSTRKSIGYSHVSTRPTNSLVKMYTYNFFRRVNTITQRVYSVDKVLKSVAIAEKKKILAVSVNALNPRLCSSWKKTCSVLQMTEFHSDPTTCDADDSLRQGVVETACNKRKKKRRNRQFSIYRTLIFASIVFAENMLISRRFFGLSLSQPQLFPSLNKKKKASIREFNE